MKKLTKPIIFGISPLFIIIWVVLAVVFKLNGQWDIALSAHFFTPGKGFLIDDNNLFGNIIYRGVHIVTALLIMVYALYLFVAFAKKKKVLLGIKRKTILYLFIVMIVGPGIVVNVVLKEGIGRARPANIEMFESKEQKFTPAFTFSDQCKSNCSFVSGHASFGYYWVVLGLIATSVARRRAGIAFGIFMGASIGLVRIMQGRHFLSDVVFAFFFVYATAAIIHWLMYVKFGNKDVAPKLENT